MSIDRRHTAGFTLIELIVFIVIVSVGLAGVLASLNISARGSADPLPPKQALAIAEGLLEEILLKSYTDPDGTNVGETRGTYDNVTDFDVPDDATATAIAGDLVGTSFPTGYSAKAEVVTTTLGPGGSTVPALQVTVTVTHPTGSISLTGFRSNY